MPYQKPIVTIELAEYNELQKFKEMFHKTRIADYETALQTVLQCMPGSTYTAFTQRIREQLQKKGLALIIESFNEHETINVHVKKI